MKAVDTNMLIYAIDRAVLIKHEQAIRWLLQISGEPKRPILLWQVACEYLSYLRRQHNQGLFTDEQVSREIKQVCSSYELVFPNASTLTVALELFRHYSLSHWDSLLLAACINAGVTTLYSEDMSHGMTYGTVTVINPFKSA